VGDHPRDLAALTFGESGGLLSVLQALGDLPADMMEHPLSIKDREEPRRLAESLAKAPRAGDRLPHSGAAIPLEAIRGVVRSIRRPSSMRSRSTDGGRLSSNSRAFESCAIASTVAERFEARCPARCQ
jgi:hypothetical protein